MVNRNSQTYTVIQQCDIDTLTNSIETLRSIDIDYIAEAPTTTYGVIDKCCDDLENLLKDMDWAFRHQDG